MKRLLVRIIPLIVLGSVVFYACRKAKIEEPPVVDDGPSLYERLGGTKIVEDPTQTETIEQGRLNLRSVVDSTIFVIAGDAKLAPYFNSLLVEVGAGTTSGLTTLSENLTDFFCAVTGATNEAYAYAGMNMKDAHDVALNKRMGFPANAQAFDRFVADFVVGLAQNGITETAIVGDLAALLNTLKSDIVQTEEDPTPQPDPTIYDKLGGVSEVADSIAGGMIERGRLRIRSMVDSSIYIIAADTILQPYFEKLLAEVGDGDMTGFAALSENLTDYLCVATGAKNPDYAYVGLNMVDAHDPTVNARMKFASTDMAFDSFVADFLAGSALNGVTNEGLVGEIKDLLESLRPKVVQTTGEPLTLYKKLGGSEMASDPAGGNIEKGRLNLRSVVDSTIFIIAGDAQMQPFFEVLLVEVGSSNVSGLTALSENLTDFFCEASGATNPAYAYNGLNMVDAHDPAKNSRMGVKAGDSDFDRFKNHIVAGAAQNGVVDAAIVGELGALIESLRSDVVQK